MKEIVAIDAFDSIIRSDLNFPYSFYSFSEMNFKSLRILS